MLNNEILYSLNEERFNKPALKEGGVLSKTLISIGYGNFIRLHDSDWATIININDVDYTKTSIRVHRGILNNKMFNE